MKELNVSTRLQQEKRYLPKIWEVQQCIARYQESLTILLKVPFKK